MKELIEINDCVINVRIKLTKCTNFNDCEWLISEFDMKCRECRNKLQNALIDYMIDEIINVDELHNVTRILDNMADNINIMRYVLCVSKSYPFYELVNNIMFDLMKNIILDLDIISNIIKF